MFDGHCSYQKVGMRALNPMSATDVGLSRRVDIVHFRNGQQIKGTEFVTQARELSLMLNAG